jgi:hypothetical protein
MWRFPCRQSPTGDKTSNRLRKGRTSESSKDRKENCIIDLKQSATAWQKKKYLTREEQITNEVRALLNITTPENKETIISKLVEVQLQTARELEVLINVIFHRVTNDVYYLETYVDMVRILSQTYPEFPPEEENHPPSDFRRMLVNLCQNKFEDLLACTDLLVEKDPAMGLEEYEELVIREKGCAMATMKFIGHLYLGGLIVTAVIRQVLIHLLKGTEENPDSPPALHVEYALELIRVTGYELDNSEKDKAQLQIFLARLDVIKTTKRADGKPGLSKRLQYLIQDLIDLRWSRWATKHKAEIKKLDDIQKDQAALKREAARAGSKACVSQFKECLSSAEWAMAAREDWAVAKIVYPQELLACDSSSMDRSLEEPDTCTSKVSSASEDSAGVLLAKKVKLDKSIEDNDTASDVSVGNNTIDASESSCCSRSEGDMSEAREALQANGVDGDLSCEHLDKIPYDNAFGIDSLDLLHSTMPNSFAKKSDFDYPCSASLGSDHLGMSVRSIPDSVSEEPVNLIDNVAFFSCEGTEACSQISAVPVSVLTPISCLTDLRSVPPSMNSTARAQTHSQVEGQVPVTLDPETNAHPRQDPACLTQFIKYDCNSLGFVFCAEWYVDSLKLSGNSCSIVSPSVEVPPVVLGGESEACVFKLMLTSKRSRMGSATIRLRCESSVRNSLEGSFDFKITFVEKTYGPVSHDFYSHPVADMSEKPDCKFLKAVGSTSKKLLIRLEIWPSASVSNNCSILPNSEAPEALPEDTCDNAQCIQSQPGLANMSPSQPQKTKGTGGRRRSEAGRRNQYERWLHRKQERVSFRSHADTPA